MYFCKTDENKKGITMLQNNHKIFDYDIILDK